MSTGMNNDGLEQALRLRLIPWTQELLERCYPVCDRNGKIVNWELRPAADALSDQRPSS